MTEVVVVRHGETPWNVERRVQGWEDIPLNETGIRQAQALARHLARTRQHGNQIDAIYSSDLQRARMTAEIVGQTLSIPVVLDEGVRERHFGVLQGLVFSTMEEHQPEAARIWKSRDPDAILPEGESLRRFHERVTQAIDAIAARHLGQRVMVVSHGGAMDIIWRHAKQASIQAPREAELLNASINRIRVFPARWEIIEWGNVTHLAGHTEHDLTA
jgi:probable phosphoglycerate mutase